MKGVWYTSIHVYQQNDMIDIIIDTDIGNDSDDAGALAIAHHLMKLGECRILAITSSTSRKDGALCVDAINRFYNHMDIKVGMSNRTTFLDETMGYGAYSRAVIKQYPYDLKNIPDSTTILREALAKATQPVVFITLGPLNNIKDLLLSKPDKLSPLNGMDLIQQKVERFVMMGGDFSPEGVTYMLGDEPMTAEWNILQDIPAAQYVIQMLKTPILFVPYAVGLIKTGNGMFVDESYDSPIKLSYVVHNNGPRQSWDPIAVYIAIRDPQSLFKISEAGQVSVLEDGKTVFEPCIKGQHHYLVDHINETKTIESLDRYIL